jgi:agmatine deiminase
MNPAELGFSMPPEWSQHSATLMEFPVREALWPEPFEDILEAYGDIAKKVSRFEPVKLIVRPDMVKQAIEVCGSDIEILEMEHNDSWARDNGPTFIKNAKGEIAGINWKFNAWGGKYPYELDDLVAPRVLELLGVPRFDVPMVLEGGSIHVDGEGTLITTEECLLNRNRNAHLTKGEIEEILKRNLNIKKIIWLKRGLYGDDTDGHVDNVACFARPGVILIQTCSERDNPNYELSEQNLEILRSEADAKGRTFEIIQIEQPAEAYYGDLFLTLSYINFYFVNGGIILPQFGGEFAAADKAAKEVLESTFPDREIVTIDGMKIIRGGGNVHCLTQQIPAGTPANLQGGI